MKKVGTLIQLMNIKMLEHNIFCVQNTIIKVCSNDVH
jgi:hypothetical protein